MPSDSLPYTISVVLGKMTSTSNTELLAVTQKDTVPLRKSTWEMSRVATGRCFFSIWSA